MALTSVEICTGAGGQALGLKRAGFKHRAVLKIDRHACETFRRNRPGWNVIEQDFLTWEKINAYRQAGNAFLKPVANAVGEQIRKAHSRKKGLRVSA